MQRIIMHWTAGGGRASQEDRKHYHRLVEHDGTVIKGTEAIEDNIVTSDGDYAAHTRNLNTGSIGVAMCGMRGAKEYPFDAGPSPLTEMQFLAFCRLVGDLCREYGIPITRETVLTHAEVQPTLGVKQLGKWDIARLPFKPGLVGALPVGDFMRETIARIAGLPHDELTMPTLRMGNEAPRAAVMMLQQDLALLGYHTGRKDGIFGQITRRGVMAFQADNGLEADGIVGAQTWAALERAKPAPAREVSEDSLRQAKSGTIRDADRAQMVAKAGAATAFGGIGLDTVLDAAGRLSGAESAIEVAQRVLMDNWPVLIVGAVALGAWFYLPSLMASIRDRRVEDARSGAHLGR